MFLLIACVFSLSPVVFIPGLTGTKINVSITKPEAYSMCPPSLQTPTDLYPLDPQIKAQYPDCVGWLYRTIYDKSTGILRHPDGIKMDLAGRIRHHRYHGNVHKIC